jgi:hypothetical protein
MFLEQVVQELMNMHAAMLFDAVLCKCKCTYRKRVDQNENRKNTEVDQRNDGILERCLLQQQRSSYRTFVAAARGIQRCDGTAVNPDAVVAQSPGVADVVPKPEATAPDAVQAASLRRAGARGFGPPTYVVRRCS